jgi:hypothetical protein
MPKTLHDWWGNGRMVRQRVWKETRFPLLGALIWAGISVYRDANSYEIFKDFSTAFFFCFFLGGQLFRMAKNVRDEQNSVEWASSFASIQEGIDALRKDQARARAQPAPARQNQKEMEYVDRVSGFTQATAAIQNGLYYPGAVMAAVGFEQAVRHLAELVEMNTRQSLAALVERMTRGSDLRQQLQNLVRLRNSLIHSAHPQKITTEQEAKEVLEAFKRGVAALADRA